LLNKMGYEVTYSFLREHGRAGVSHVPGNKCCFHLPFVLQEFPAELFEQDLLIDLYFGPDGGDTDHKGNKCGYLADGNSRSRKCDEDTGVHRDIPFHSSRLPLVAINNYISDVWRLI